MCCTFAFLYGAAIYIHAYLLPLYFQGVRGTSAAGSSISCLPFDIPLTLFSVLYGITATRTGHFIPFIWVGSILYVVGSVLLSQLSPQSSTLIWAGYQIVCGIGIGLSVQVPYIAMQVVLPQRDTPTACSMEIFFGDLGGAIGLNVAQNILRTYLRDGLTDGSTPVLPGLSSSAGSVTNEGILDLVKASRKLSKDMQALFAKIMNGAITRAFVLPIVAACLAAMVSWGLERRYIEDDRETEGYKEVPGYELEDRADSPGPEPIDS